MARGAKGTAAAFCIVDRPCPKCSGNEYAKRGSRNRCLVCERQASREYKTRERRDDPALAMWRRTKARAQRSGVPFALTVSEVRQAWPVDGRCPALGIPLQVGRGAPRDASPSLDRLVPSWGYMNGNVCVISSKANRIKSDATAAELEAVAAWMRQTGLA